MWMSNLLIVVNPNNADRNGLNDLAAAITEANAQIISIDEQNHVIEAAAPTHEVPLIAAMDGVSYIRTVFTYFSGEPIKAA